MNAPLHTGEILPGAAAPDVSIMAAPVVPGMNGATLVRPGSSEETYTDLALMAGDAGGNLATGILKTGAGAAGTAVSGAFSVVGTEIHHRREIEKLLEVYRDTVAAQLGIPANAVNEADLRAAAEKFPENKALREEFAAMDEQSVTSPVRAVVTSAAALAGGAAAALVGLPAAGIGGLATGLAGSVAAGQVAGRVMDGILGKENNLTPFVALQQADAKLQSGEGISARDMFLFHVASDKNLATQIEGHMGDRFEDLPPEKQTRTMLRDHPLLTELCKYEAYQLNSKALPAASLMDERVQAAVKQEFEQAQRPQGRIMTTGSTVSPLAPRSQIVVQNATQNGYAQAIEAQRAAQTAQNPQGLVN